MKQGGTAGIPSLTKVYFVKDFFVWGKAPFGKKKTYIL